MLIERVSCPFGCVNSVMLESTKTVASGNSNLLLDSTKSAPQVTEIVKVYSCNCCGRSFESKQQNEGKTVI
jgi:hypothetical protein